MRNCVISLFVFVLSFSLLAEPGDNTPFVTLTPFNHKTNPNWGTVLKDIMNHEAPNDVNNFKDQMTLGHETTHGIHAYLRNHSPSSAGRVNCFYVLQNRAITITEPSIRKSAVAESVPRILRGDRFTLYVVQQKEWDDTPLYLFDEWVAYANGGDVGVDLVQKGLWKGTWTDGVSGQLEFVVYALATAMAIADRDPEYLKTNQAFREFLAWNIERSIKTFTIGSQMSFFKWDKQDKYFANLKSHPEAQGLRTFTRSLFGANWANRVLGFSLNERQYDLEQGMVNLMLVD